MKAAGNRRELNCATFFECHYSTKNCSKLIEPHIAQLVRSSMANKKMRALPEGRVSTFRLRSAPTPAKFPSLFHQGELMGNCKPSPKLRHGGVCSSQSAITPICRTAIGVDVHRDILVFERFSRSGVIKRFSRGLCVWGVRVGCALAFIKRGTHPRFPAL